eukprot:COSAG01_NODE_18772_length_1054_cov_1.172775_2_plen_185_part_00
MELVPGSPVGASRINGPTRQIPGTQVLECTHSSPPPPPRSPHPTASQTPHPPGHAALSVAHPEGERGADLDEAGNVLSNARRRCASLRFVSGIRTRCHRADAVNLSRCGALAPPEASSSNAFLPSSALAARGAGAAAGPARLARGHAEPVAPRAFLGGAGASLPGGMWRSAPLCGRVASLAVGR